ncbi:MAG: hypothetical protein ACAI43_11265 [Phycisphaerae bacterium]|nr:hypothetical protein [Tepidisphaeraceae bacterium]
MPGRPYLDELVAIFAQSEAEQERYFPELSAPVWLEDVDAWCETRDARFIALCVLVPRARKGEIFPDPELSQACWEIIALVKLMIQSTATYPWLVAHPRVIRDEQGANDQGVDPVIYGVWDVLRRLCRTAAARLGTPVTPRPFAEVFGEFIVPLEKREA